MMHSAQDTQRPRRSIVVAAVSLTSLWQLAVLMVLSKVWIEELHNTLTATASSLPLFLPVDISNPRMNKSRKKKKQVGR